jgi:gliding motility-associated lipoprotein GldH
VQEEREETKDVAKEMIIEKSRPIAGTTLLLIVVLTLSSCRNRSYYADSAVIPEASWSSDKPVLFNAQIDDTVTPFDIGLTIRTNPEYPYRNLFLFFTTTSPGGVTIRDTVEYLLSDEKGERFGTGAGAVTSLKVPFKVNVIFPDKGLYRFRIEQGMRREELGGIVDIGLIITEHK